MKKGDRYLIVYFIFILFLSSILIQVFGIGSGLSGRSDGIELEPDISDQNENYVSDAIIQTTTTRSRYPQQDGGTDDRLFEYRSMWLEGYQIINHSEVLKVIDVARNSNINCLTPLINGHYLGTFYNSSFHPRYKDLAWNFDPLMDLIREAHKYSIHVMPWFHTMLDYQAVSDHPEWGAVTSTGGRSGAWMNAALPEVQSYLSNVSYQLLRDYPLDGIHLDTIRYPSSSYGYDDYSIQKYNDEGWTSFTEFRKQQITDVVTALYDTISSIRPYVLVGADIGSNSWRETSWFQDTDRWAEMGKIDFVTPMIYTLNSDYLENIIRWNVDLHSCPVVCGNYVYVPEDPYYGTVPDEETGIELLLNQTERALKAGAIGTCFFAYKFLATHPKYHNALKEGVFSEKALCPLKNQTIPVRNLRWEFDREHDRMGWRTTDMGHNYPYEGVWSISNILRPALMSPLINISADEINVLEISMKSESTEGSIDIYWSYNETVFTDDHKVSFKIKETGDWHLYSLHMDDSKRWNGHVRYIRIIPNFSEKTNITLDFISLQWMPRCIQNWSYLGPFFNGKDEEILHRDFIDDEGSGNPRIGDVVSGKVWAGYEMERDLVDYRFLFGHLEYAVTYANVYVVSDSERDLDIRVGSSDAIMLWVNGEIVTYNALPRRVAPDQNISSIHLNQGINSIMLKLANYRNEFSHYVRLTHNGNETAEGLEYLYDIPQLSAPVVTFDRSGWISDNDIEMSWDPVKGERAPIFYEWKIDNEKYERIEDRSIILSDLPDGQHIFSVRSVDELGKSSGISDVAFKTDRSTPLITYPVSISNTVISRKIRWNWDVEREPISGITGFLLTVERWKPSGQYLDSPINDILVDKTEFTLNEHILDGYSYILRVTAISGSIVTFSTGSDPVLVDLTPPTRPRTVTLVHQEGYPMYYLLEWSPSYQHFNKTVERYEIFQRDLTGQWFLFDTIYETQYMVHRNFGERLAFKIRGIDDAGQLGIFSDVARNINLPPTPLIYSSDHYLEGGIFNFSAMDSFDRDGSIIFYQWSLNGMSISSMSRKNITLESGIYILDLEVWDDLGSSASTNTTLHLQKSACLEFNGSITDWLIRTSVTEELLPAKNITIYNNNTIYLEKEEEEMRNEERKEFSFTILFITISTLGIISFLLLMGIIASSEIISYRMDNNDARNADEMKEENGEKSVNYARNKFIATFNILKKPPEARSYQYMGCRDMGSMDDQISHSSRFIRSTSPPIPLRNETIKDRTELSGTRSIGPDIKRGNAFYDENISDGDLEDRDLNDHTEFEHHEVTNRFSNNEVEQYECE